MSQSEYSKLNYYSQAGEADRGRFRDWMKGMLRVGPMTVTFVKSDGTERTMTCTLQEEVAIPHVATTDRKKPVNNEVCPVWDLEKNAWRSFRYDAIKEVSIDI